MNHRIVFISHIALLYDLFILLYHNYFVYPRYYPTINIVKTYGTEAYNLLQADSLYHHLECQETSYYRNRFYCLVVPLTALYQEEVLKSKTPDYPSQSVLLVYEYPHL